MGNDYKPKTSSNFRQENSEIRGVPLKTCRNCGLTWKWEHYCPAEENICKLCGKIGHVARMCRSSRQKKEHDGSVDHQNWRRKNDRDTANSENTPPPKSPHENNSYRNQYRQSRRNQDRDNFKPSESRRVDTNDGNWRERTTRDPRVFSNDNKKENRDNKDDKDKNSGSLNENDSHGRFEDSSKFPWWNYNRINNTRTSRNNCNENWRASMKNNETDDDERSSLNSESLINWRLESRCFSGKDNNANHNSTKSNNFPTDDNCSESNAVGNKSKSEYFHQEQKKYDAIGFKQKLAKLSYDRGKYETALSQYSRLIELCPDNPKNFNNRSACFMMMEQYDKAAADAGKVIELDPSCVKGYERVIKCKILLGQAIPAIIYLTRLSKIDPENKLIVIEQKKLDEWRGHFRNVIIAVENKNYQNALECINKCLTISPHCVSYKIKKAKYLASLERYNEAQQVLSEILTKGPVKLDVVYLMGLCLYHSDIDEALKYFKEILRLDPDHFQCLQIYKKTIKIVELRKTGNEEFKSGNFSVAHDIYSSAILIDPDNTFIKAKLTYNMGQASYHSAHFETAIEEFSRVIIIDPNHIKALTQRGKCYREMKDYDEAITDFSKVRRLDPGNKCRKLIDDAEKLLASVKKDFYTILGVTRDSSIEELKKAYKDKAMLHHPDRHSASPVELQKKHERKFKDITVAYRDLLEKYK